MATNNDDTASAAAEALAQLQVAHEKIDEAVADETVTHKRVGEELRDRAVLQALKILDGKVKMLQATANMLDTNVNDLNHRVGDSATALTQDDGRINRLCLRVRELEVFTQCALTEERDPVLAHLRIAITHLRQYAEAIGKGDQARVGQVTQCLSIMYQHYGVIATTTDTEAGHDSGDA